GDMTSANRVITRVLKSGSTEDIDALGRIIDKQSMLVERNGGDPSELVRQSTRVRIEQRMQRMPGSTELEAIRTLEKRLPAYEPATPLQAGLPQAVYPRGTALAMSERWVSRIIEIRADLELPPAFKNADGIELMRRGAPGETPRDLTRAASEVGP